MVGVCAGAAEEEWLLAGRKDEEFGDLVAQRLGVRWRGRKYKSQDAPHRSPHDSSSAPKRRSAELGVKQGLVLFRSAATSGVAATEELSLFVTTLLPLVNRRGVESSCNGKFTDW